ncbi:hypothetical protein BKA59DRAFT_238206 [Fusarium tricinctum]|uniref:DUF2828 domain-containing protein n=1 Tax=Fusarium tricinctum TaxID=61284 RepID=A0A8K0RPT8_9HYPO|nr:hypothetical protein BKA59DRAFT_238206 [Fusarium tricinctum]
MASPTTSDMPWFLKSSCPVLFPFEEVVRKPQAEFEDYLRREIAGRHDDTSKVEGGDADQAMTDADKSETFTLVSDSTSGEIRQGLEAINVSDHTAQESKTEDAKPAESHPFMEGLINYGKEEPLRNLENMMCTENGDLAYRSSEDALVDLFQELEDVVSGPRLLELLSAAWKENPIATLRIIFNARSIHLGKSSRTTFYRCAGWLAQYHPLTLVANLPWLTRPIIEKRVEKKDEKKEDEDIVIVDNGNEDVSTKYNVKDGVAHGYWKDLLNLLALTANDKLTVLDNPKDVLNSENPGIIRGKSTLKLGGRGGRRSRGTARASRAGGHSRGIKRGRISPTMETRTEKDDGDEEAKRKSRLGPKEFRRESRADRHETAVIIFKNDPVYRALHLSIARLFAEQLKRDVQALRGDDKQAKRSISLCGKWAPSHDHFHDRHTFIVSTIAEILYPRGSIDNEKLNPTDDRETYLRFAREEYRKDTSALRKHLEIVEREITAKKYENIKYDRVPSLAMNQYSKLFIENDIDRFGEYLDRVAEGKANISGATLLPSTLIHKVRAGASGHASDADQLLKQKIADIESKVVDGQWNTLVQRIKDSGTMESSIAVCDVSGSMSYPVFSDKTAPIDSAVGLSLLLAEVSKPPFGGTFITFSEKPAVVQIDLSKTLREKVEAMDSSDWGMSTNFVSVFEDLILPMAIQNNLKQEDMVKRVFVFSDMQFNEASEPDPWSSDYSSGGTIPQWNTSFERVKSKFKQAGYEIPELVFWNLAGGRAGYAGSAEDAENDGDPIAPKPVKSDEEGTCLVSGYSQGMLKVFLDEGAFEEEEGEDDEDEVVVEKDEEGNVTEKKKKVKMTPLKIVQKAISHKAYEMLRVVD